MEKRKKTSSTGFEPAYPKIFAVTIAGEPINHSGNWTIYAYLTFGSLIEPTFGSLIEPIH